MKVSLIIPTYNKLSRLRLVIASLKKQTYAQDKYEVIFVNDGSDDGTDEFFNKLELPFNYRYLYQSNSGRAAARNLGIRASRNELIIFVDDDVILCPGFIEEHVAMQEKGPGVVHGKIINLSYLKFFQDPVNGVLYHHLKTACSDADGLRRKCITEEDILERFDEVVASNKKLTPFEIAIKSILTEHSPKAAWVAFTGGNTSVPRDWLINEGGFDESFGLKWGCEDLEMGYRLFISGAPFYYCESAVNYHIAHYRQNFEKEHAETIGYFFGKHRDEKILLLQEFVEGKIKKEEFVSLMVSD